MKAQIIQTQIDMLKKEYDQALVERNTQKAKQIMKKLKQKITEYSIAKDEERLQTAMENGSMDRLRRLIGAAQALNSVTNNLIQEAATLLTYIGLHTDGIVAENKLYIKAADRYFKEFSRLVETDQDTLDMFKDLEAFEDWFRVWSGLKERPKEQRLRGCLKAARKADGLSTMCRKCKMHADPYSIMCKACSKAFIEGFQKGAKWLDNKLYPKEEIKQEEE